MVSGEEDWTLVARLKAKYGLEWLALAATEDGELKLEKMSQFSINPDDLEAVTWDILLSTLVNNMNRIRHQIVTIAGRDWGEAEAAVLKSLFNANTMLYATTDDTPVALTVAASRIVGRKSTGAIGALTGAECRTILDVPTNDEAVLDTLFDSNTILKADSNDTPVALYVPASRILGRRATGGIGAMTVAELKTMLALVIGDITINDDLVMGAHDITLGAGQTVDGVDISEIVAVPSGVILLWSGAISAIPSGYILCDGANDTPDLTDRFVIHADADAAGTRNVDDIGGAMTHTLTTAELASHRHTIGFTGGGNGVPTADNSCAGNGYTCFTGSGDAHSILNKFHALAYIMKT